MVEESEFFVPANHAFTSDIYKTLAETEGNVFVSPISIQFVLLMLYMGSRGKTEKVLSEKLLWSGKRTRFDHLQGVGDLSVELNKASQLNLANQLFLEENFKVKDGFKNEMKIFFNTAAQLVSFVTQPEPSRVFINKWASEQTHDKINNLLPPGTIDTSTRLVLVNAIHFKGEWTRQFLNSSYSIEKPFYLSNFDKTTKVKMMVRPVTETEYANNGAYQALRLRYKNGNFSMLILLPTKIEGLAALEKNLPSVGEVLKTLHKTNVYVELPKFKLQKYIPLNDALSKIGLGDIFAPDADYSGIADGNIAVSSVIQKSFVEVNEEGTEAAAATAAVAAVLSGHFPATRPPQFIADHPFIFYILNKDFVLFAGRFSSPEA